MSKRPDPTRRWHSPLWQAMTAAQRTEFRELVARPETRIEDALNWCVERDLASSQSAVHRLMQRLAAEAACDQIRAAREASEQIMAAATDDGAIASGQSAVLQLAGQRAFDWLLRHPEITEAKEVNALTNIIRSQASAVAVELQRYKADVERRAREAADAAARIGRENKLDAAAIDQIRRAVFGVVAERKAGQ